MVVYSGAMLPITHTAPRYDVMFLCYRSYSLVFIQSGNMRDDARLGSLEWYGNAYDLRRHADHGDVRDFPVRPDMRRKSDVYLT